MCPHTLKHQSTGVTGSEDCPHTAITVQGEIESIFIFFGLTHVNELYV